MDNISPQTIISEYVETIRQIYTHKGISNEAINNEINYIKTILSNDVSEQQILKLIKERSEKTRNELNNLKNLKSKLGETSYSKLVAELKRRRLDQHKKFIDEFV